MRVFVAAIISTVILEMETPLIIYNFNELLTVLISTRICSSLYFSAVKAFILILFSIAFHYYTFDCNFRKPFL
jgi:hypothetical protein